MLKQKSQRSSAALERFKIFEGVPPYDTRKKFVVTDALKLPFCALGDLCVSVGWGWQGFANKLEEKRTERGTAYYKRNIKRKAIGAKELSAINTELEKYGY